jgi:hypothetical protein
VLDFDTEELTAEGGKTTVSESGRRLRARFEEAQVQKSFLSPDEGEAAPEVEVDVGREMASRLTRYASQNADQLGLDPNLKIQARGFHPVFRVAPNGRLVIELIAQFAQQDTSRKTELGGLPFRGGVTLVIGTDGNVRYVVRKPMPSANLPDELRRQGEARLARQLAYLGVCDAKNPGFSYLYGSEYEQRMAGMTNFARLHEE